MVSFRPGRRITRFGSEKRISFLRTSGAEEDVELVSQCVRGLFSFCFKHLFAQMSETAPLGRTGHDFSKTPEIARNILLDQSAENLASKIAGDVSSVAGGPPSTHPRGSEVFSARMQRMSSSVRDERVLNPRHTITE